MRNILFLIAFGILFLSITSISPTSSVAFAQTASQTPIQSEPTCTPVYGGGTICTDTPTPVASIITTTPATGASELGIAVLIVSAVGGLVLMQLG